MYFLWCMCCVQLVVLYSRSSFMVKLEELSCNCLSINDLLDYCDICTFIIIALH